MRFADVNEEEIRRWFGGDLFNLYGLKLSAGGCGRGGITNLLEVIRLGLGGCRTVPSLL